ncbi:type II 3-dehydroquinate dehydratase [Flavobacteriales bacterium]|jgi:3-dehydroquinate dehydratase-2|nr:type II 3-dehydroquinate dehydratase [Flavobacteriales bacterium]MDC3389546.1 type II 3-dehydroquinate dehydratase [Flavobacteriales bacterium]
MKKIIIINGPNLNLIGEREPKVYGNSSMEDYLSEIRNNFPEIQIDYFQSNVEGDLINKLQEVGFSYDGVVLNAGGYTHTSVAISDAVAAIHTSVVEVHISNVYKREEYRHQSLMAKNCIGVVAGFGLHSYKMAIDSFL